MEAVRQGIRRRYKDGGGHGSNRKIAKVTKESDLTAEDITWKKAQAVFLKAADYSYSYISDSTMVGRTLVKKWFAEDQEMKKRVAAIREDMSEGGIQLLKTYAIDAIEGIMEIARRTDDDSISLKAYVEILDRIGIAKVNKSDSKVTKQTEVSLTDPEGLLEAMEVLPLETQQRLAKLSSEMEELVVSGRGKG